MTIAENLQYIRQNINIALKNRTNRHFDTGDDVTLIAVTKTQPVELIRDAVANQVRAVGENRIQEAVNKRPQLDPALEWHLIGHLQTNKSRQAVSLFDLIHSVDSERLALELNIQAGKIGKRQNVLLQVNVAGEESKYGIPPEISQVFTLARLISAQEHLQLCGLMTIAPFLEDPEDLRPVFRGLYNIFGELQSAALPNTKIQWLSMGMTNDYMIAVEEGANMVRIGTGIFATR